jgi:prepilin-type processing-associated H-X9-DG protein
MVSVTQAFTIDLTGQVCTESRDGALYGGVSTGPAFHRGALASPGGMAIVCLASRTPMGRSAISPHLGPHEAVAIPRADVHWVITEYGTAYLFGRSVAERAVALIEIAHPDVRSDLLDAATARGLVSIATPMIESHGITLIGAGTLAYLMPVLAIASIGLLLSVVTRNSAAAVVGTLPGGGAYDATRMTVWRHKGGANVAFFDGHCAWLRKDEIYSRDNTGKIVTNDFNLNKVAQLRGADPRAQVVGRVEAGVHVGEKRVRAVTDTGGGGQPLGVALRGAAVVREPRPEVELELELRDVAPEEQRLQEDRGLGVLGRLLVGQPEVVRVPLGLARDRLQHERVDLGQGVVAREPAEARRRPVPPRRASARARSSGHRVPSPAGYARRSSSPPRS